MEKRENDHADRQQANQEQNLDSPINTMGTNGNDTRSLTNDESADTDPNEVDKPSLGDSERGNNDRGRFDGEIGI